MGRNAATQVAECATCILHAWRKSPRIGVILGTGLSQAADRLEIDCELPYERVPHFPSSTALSHEGRLVCGRVAGVPALVMAGRFHLYEGYEFDQVTLPIHVMHALGVEVLIVTNASGGLNPRFRGGDILIIADHLNFLFAVGRAEHAEPRMRPVCCDPNCNHSTPCRGRGYDDVLIDQALHIARREGFAAHCGTYVAVAGPNYETRAEYRMFRRLGGDAVGMSTVPEVLTATSLGMRVLGLSMITNVARPDAPEKVDPRDVVAWAARAEPNLWKIVQGIAAALPQAAPA
jgi:purine-nucleoside phosphorylase